MFGSLYKSGIEEYPPSDKETGLRQITEDLRRYPTIQEVILGVANRAFDFAFCLCLVDSAEASGEPEVVAEVDEGGIKLRGGEGVFRFRTTLPRLSQRMTCDTPPK